jgi:hypothetical protein
VSDFIGFYAVPNFTGYYSAAVDFFTPLAHTPLAQTLEAPMLAASPTLASPLSRAESPSLYPRAIPPPQPPPARGAPKVQMSLPSAPPELTELEANPPPARGAQLQVDTSLVAAIYTPPPTLSQSFVTAVYAAPPTLSPSLVATTYTLPPTLSQSLVAAVYAPPPKLSPSLVAAIYAPPHAARHVRVHHHDQRGQQPERGPRPLNVALVQIG